MHCTVLHTFLLVTFFLHYLPDAWFAAPLSCRTPDEVYLYGNTPHVAGNFTLFADCTSHVFHSQILREGNARGWVGGSGWVDDMTAPS